MIIHDILKGFHRVCIEVRVHITMVCVQKIEALETRILDNVGLTPCMSPQQLSALIMIHWRQSQGASLWRFCEQQQMILEHLGIYVLTLCSLSYTQHCPVTDML